MPRLKQYVATSNIKSKKYSWKKHQLIRMEEQEALPYLSGMILIPYSVAVSQNIEVNTGKKAPSKKVKATTTSKEETVKAESKKSEPKKEESKKADSTSKEPEKKPLIGNQLRKAVQAKKKAAAETEAATEPPQVDEDKLAAIKSGGKK